MAKLKDTTINGNLSINNNFSVVGSQTGFSIDIDQEFLTIYNSISDIDPIETESDEEV